MSKSKSPVFNFDAGDPEMQEAYEQARATFRYFWRELAWERRRIIPALDMAGVKAAFSDPTPRKSKSGTPDVEHMWVNEIDFDGETVSGVLMNRPNHVKLVKQGDPVHIPLAEISDWIYSSMGDVYGAHTVNLMRSRMAAKERREHDKAWGLSFGDPNVIRLVPDDYRTSDGGVVVEHPMSESMASSLRDHLAQNPDAVHDTDDRGWTFLHQLALAGSSATVAVLLDHKADPNAKTPQGATPLQLARSLVWDKVAALLVSRGAK